MARLLPHSLFMAALLASATAAPVIFAPQPALAYRDGYANTQVSFRFFYDRLAPYGRWIESDRWGYAWHPEDVGPGFRPYYDGHWVDTERYGWYWVSEEDWGDIVYHYGRWVYDPDDGWLWVPGYVWGPAWVIWREGEGSTGWFPMPPDDDFYAGDEDYNGYTPADDYYGYDQWYGPSFAVTFFSLWLFVDNDHFDDRHFHHFIRHDFDGRDRFWHTHDETHITVVNNFVVNQGVDPQRLHRQNGRPIIPVQLRDVVHSAALQPVPVDMGRQIHHREMQERSDFRPRWMQQGGTLHASPFTARPVPKDTAQPQIPPRMEANPSFEPRDREFGVPPRHEHREDMRRHRERPDNSPPSGDTGTPNVMTQHGNAVMQHVPPVPMADRPMSLQPPAPPMPPERFNRFEQRQPQQNFAPPPAPARQLEHFEPPPGQTRQRPHDEGTSPGDQPPREQRRHNEDTSPGDLPPREQRHNDDNSQGDQNPREHRRHNPEP